jgi:hypothetical protein
MAWIESHQSLATHRKTLALSRLLGISRPQVIGHLHLLWWWCLDNAPDGDISRIDPSDVSLAMLWSGEASTIIGAMVSVGFIDPTMRVHGWDEYAEKLITRRAENARRNRELRERKKQLLLPISRDTHEIITRPSRDGATVPNSTVPNSITKEVVKKEQPAVPLKDLFFSFKDDHRYDGIDFENEFKKFCEYWIEGKRKLNNRKLAAHNWLDKCLERNGGKNDATSSYRGNPSQKPAGAFADLE